MSFHAAILGFLDLSVLKVEARDSQTPAIIL